MNRGHAHQSWFQHFFAPVSPHGAHFIGKLLIGAAIILVILALLHAAPKQYRRGIIAVFTFLGGVYYFAEYFWPVNPHTDANWLTPYQDFVAHLSAVIASFATGLGVISLWQFHSKVIMRGRSGWGNSVMLFVAAIAMCVFTLLDFYEPKRVLFRDPFFGGRQNVHGVYLLLFNGGLNSLDAATFSLIAFFIASAAYRAFRIRSVEASLLMVSALIVMLASTTLGTVLTNWIPNTGITANFRIEHISEWLLTRLNAPAQRGILFGLEIGALATALRLWLSLERGAFFEAEV